MPKVSGISALLSAFMIVTVTTTAVAQVPCLSGFVRDENGNPVIDVDLDFDNAVTGQRIYTPNDNTDEFGFYRVCILAGTYHISFGPPVGVNLLGRRFFYYQLNQSEALDVTLPFGKIIRGTVRDSLGQPIAGVDFDVDSLGAGRVYTPNDNTDSSGGYWLVTPEGHFRVRLTPPAGSRFREVEIDSIYISGDTTIDFQMSTGHILSGVISGAGGAGLDSITVDIRDHYTGEKIFVPNNETDSLGNYRVVLPTGTFTVRYRPPYGSRYAGGQVDSVVVSSDFVINQSLVNGILINIAVQDSLGAGVSLADLDFTLESNGQRLYIPYDKTDSLGQTIVSLPADSYTIRIDPPIGSILDRMTLRNVAVRVDTSMHFVLHEVSRVSFGGRLINGAGAGLSEISLSLRSAVGGPEIPLSGNITDSLGYFDFNVPIGTFTLYIIPPRGSHYLGMFLENISFGQDTVWNATVIDSGVVFSARVMDQNGLPLSGADFDFALDSVGVVIFTAHDISDSLGFADIAVPRATFDITIKPPVSSGMPSELIQDIFLANDTSVTIIVAGDMGPLPYDFRLGQNYPNPFNQATSISYTLLKSSDVTIYIYNAIGQMVRVMEGGHRDAGYYVIDWDGRGEDGEPAASGLYFYRMKTSSGSESKKMLFIK